MVHIYILKTWDSVYLKKWYPGRSKRHRFRSENEPLLLLKRGIYGGIRYHYAPLSVRIRPYYLAQKYGPYCIRIVNGPYLTVFQNFTDKLRWTVLQCIITVNGRKDTRLYTFTIFFLFRCSQDEHSIYLKNKTLFLLKNTI